jgi:hypothetical protein
MKNRISNYSRWKVAVVLFVAVLGAQALVLLPGANAGALTNTYLRPDRLATTQTGHLRLVFKTNASEAGATALTVDMNGADSTTWSGQSGSVHTGAMTKDVSTCATELSVTGLPGGSLAVSGASSHTISITSITALSASTTYCIDLTNSDAVTNPSAGVYHPTITEGSGGSDSVTVAVDIIGSNADQINVSATVNPSFTFSLSSNSAGLGTLTPSTPVASSAINATVSTNAKTGWQMWSADYSGASAGLKSTTANYRIANGTGGYTPAAGNAVSTLSSGTEGFNLGAGTASGTVCTSASTDAKFADSGTPFRGGGLDGTLRSLATSTGPADTCALPLKVNASVSNVTPPATDYAGTITVVAAGLF